MTASPTLPKYRQQLILTVLSPVLRPLDPAAGVLLSICGLAASAYGLIRAGQVAAWSRTDVWAPITVGLVLLAAFVLAELRIKVPSFDPRLLAQRTFGGGNAALGLLLFAIAAVTFYNAFHLQCARGFSPIEAGLASLPTALGAMLGRPLAGTPTGPAQEPDYDRGGSRSVTEATPRSGAGNRPAHERL
ncbi:hypothetical protein [Streptomyces decoyicus]|uniref:hypothetical protein n=1 Tax=Streptomyces decoyicus TaxID=249567 RepID=UPI0038651EC3|nr:hypothetical protein OG532_01065 [Streptomyces decoyicus]